MADTKNKTKLKIEYVPIETIKPYAGNAKLHPQEQIDQIKKSIELMGFDDPIAIWKNGEIIEGHGRLIAAQQLGMATVPIIRLDDLTDEQRRSYALIHNKLTMNSGFDAEVLELELAEISTIDMSAFSFDMDFMQDGESSGTSNEDDFDYDSEPPAEPKAKLGDVYQLGNHRLMCGDSTDKQAWQKLMNGEKADMCFTDPPYGVSIGDKNAALNTVQPSGRCCSNIKNDTLSADKLYPILRDAMTNVKENCNDDAVYYVTSPQVGDIGMMMMMMKDAGLPVRHVLMWAKNTATFSLGRLDYDYKHEPIFYTWTKSHHNFRGGKFRTSIWEFDKPRKCDLHPTMKPVALVENAILDGTKEGMIVVDAFGGSGTTLIAAEQTNRHARLMELDPKYVDVIIDRWEKLTGKKAVKLDD